MANTALDLKKVLKTNQPMTLTIRKRAGTYPETDYATKAPTGKNVYLYIFADSAGQEYKYYAKEREEEFLRDYQPGNEVQVVRAETMKDDKRIAYQQWDVPGGAIATAVIKAPVQNNTTQIRQEKDREQAKQDEDAKWDRISIGKCIFGFMQTFIEQGKPVVEAKVLAIEAVKDMEDATAEFFTIHRSNQ